MTSNRQFREVQRWSRLISWPLVALGGIAVATFAQDSDADSRWIVQTAALSMIPLGWLLLELAGPRLEVKDGKISYSIWPVYRKEIEIAEVTSSTTKTFHPPGNDVSWYGRGGRSRMLYSVADTHYVELHLRDGSVVDLTTMHPERLAEAIRRGRLVEEYTNRAGAL
jgi:hypothetical protein